MVLGSQGGEDVFERWSDELRWWKPEGIRARSRDFAEVARPGEDVLKDVAVDGAEMRGIELATERSLVELHHAYVRKLRDGWF